MSISGPGPHAGHRAVWDVAEARLLSFGGQAAGLSAELWIYQEGAKQAGYTP